MFRSFWLLLASCLMLAGCSPTLNWREVRLAASALKVLLPCKADQGSRPVELAGQLVELQMVGCEAGAALFAVSHVELKDSSRMAEIQAGWQTAMLAAMAVKEPEVPVQRTAFELKGAAAQPPAVRLQAQGRRPDGRAVMAQAVWFSQGTHLFHAVVYAERLGPAATEPFFAGLAFE